MSGTNITTHNGQLAAVVAAGTGTVDPKAVVAQVQAIQQIMRSVMKEGTHYGVIPGTGKDAKPSLLKPGSEVLLSAFKISVEPVVTTIRDGNHITYQVQCIGKHIPTGLMIGVGIGEASTAEDKYGWREAVCQQEYDETPEDRRRVKWKKGKWIDSTRSYGPAQSFQQVRTNPADIANTVLKMGKKRGQIDLCLTALAASDIFTQDLEDLPEELRGSDASAAPRSEKPKYQAKPKAGAAGGSAPSGEITDAQVRLIKVKLESASKTEAEFLKKFDLESLEELPKAKMNDALDWITKGDGGG